MSATLEIVVVPRYEPTFAVFNPHSRPVDELPVIYGFNNGGSAGLFSGELISEDGHFLGGHCCSGEYYMPGDLGVLDGHRPDRHEGFRKHYPDGYRMEFVSYADVTSHTKLLAAFARADALDGAAE